MNTHPPHYSEEFAHEYRTSGAVRPSGHPEYDELTGYVVGEYAYEWQDRSGDRYRTVCTVINLGRPDRGVVGDVDALLRDEPWGRQSSPAATVAKTKLRLEREAAIRSRVEPALRQYGSMTSNELAIELELGLDAIVYHMRRLEGRAYCRVSTAGGVNGRAVLWGLMEDA